MLELNKLYNMDCMEGMVKFPDKYFDLAIVDPPYGIGINTNIGRRKGDKKSSYHAFAGNDSSIPCKEYFIELFRVSKNQIIWGGNYMTMHLPPSPCWILWDKLFSEDLSFAQMEMAWSSFKTSSKKFTLSPSTQKNRIHPTQKPVELYKWLLTKYAKGGDKIIDTHAGSCSSLIACLDLTFDFIGFELDTDYYRAALQRIETFKSQLKLF